MGNLDMMIAAQARSAGAVRVTNDQVFRRVKGLNSVDWTNQRFR